MRGDIHLIKGTKSFTGKQHESASIAARKDVERGRVIKIGDLTELKPKAQKVQ